MNCLESNQISGWLYAGEAEILRKYAAIANKGVVELGSYEGKSSIVLASATTVPIYCVDTFNSLGVNVEPRNTYEKFIENTKDFLNIVPIVGRTDEVCRNFNRVFDVLFIDASHDYDSVKTDFNNWFPLLSVGGVIIFHDVYAKDVEDSTQTNHPGVYMFFHELLDSGAFEIIDRANTIGVLRCKKH